MDCANLDCAQNATDLLRYRTPEGVEHRYPLCPGHLDRAHQWLHKRPALAITAISERLKPSMDQPALF